MPDQKPPLEYETPQPRPSRWRSLGFWFEVAVYLFVILVLFAIFFHPQIKGRS